jgi:hypothetical protein
MEEMLRLGKKNETEIDDTEIVVKITEKLDESELMPYRVFSKEVRADVDLMAKKWGWILQHQSDKSLGRTHFVNGITSKSKLAAHEMIGKLILYLLTFCSGYCKQYFETAADQRNVKKPVSKGGQKQTMGSDRVGDYVFALEEELLSISLLTSMHTLEFVNQYKEYIPSSMY